MKSTDYSPMEIREHAVALVQLAEKADRMQRAAETLIDMYIANRGWGGKFPAQADKAKPRHLAANSHEFISCITPGHAKSRKDRRESKYWRAWDDLRKAIGDETLPKDVS